MRPIEELTKLERYDDLTHEEVCALLDQVKFEAKCRAQIEVIHSDLYIQKQIENERVLEIYELAKQQLTESITAKKEV